MTTIKKTIAGFVGFAIALSLVAVSPAQAMTSAELAAQIAALQAQLAALGGGTTTGGSSYTFTRDLTIGSTGADVTALQNWLISKGFSIPAGATGYFGTQTQAAVSAFQSANGIAPAAGYFGPITRSKVSSMGGSMTDGGTTGGGGTTTTGGSSMNLAGTDGTIADIDQLSQYSNEEVGEGEEEVKVLGFEVEASNDGDIALKSIKLRFDPTGNSSGDSDHLDDYISGVKVWLGDTEIGSADVDDFNEESNDTYTKTITLSNAVVREDDTEKFYVTVDAANSFDSSDIDSDSWTIAIDSVRFEDGSGVVTTETSAIDTNIDWDSTGDGVAISFVDFSTAADIELKISKATDSPEEDTVTVSDDDDTDDVLLLKGKIKLEGKSDVTIDEFPVTLTSVGAHVALITNSLTLRIGDEDFSETVASTTEQFTTTGLVGTITFDDLNFDIEADDTVEFEILADINDLEGDFTAGDTLKAEVTSTNRDYMDVENEEGDQLADTDEKSGTALGDAQAFYDDGIKVTLVSTDADSVTVDSSDNDRVELTIKFKVEAVGETAYIPKFMTPTTQNTNATTGTGTSSTTPTTASGVAFHVQSSDTDLTIARLGATTLTSTADEETNTYRVDEGQAEDFTLKVIVQNAATSLLDGASIRAILAGVNFGDSDSATGDSVFTASLNEDFRTGYALIAD